jgi:hypothetical protein
MAVVTFVRTISSPGCFWLANHVSAGLPVHYNDKIGEAPAMGPQLRREDADFAISSAFHRRSPNLSAT